jgi:hypothetical protein
MKILNILILTIITIQLSAQEKALEIYFKKDESKKYLIKVDDKVMIPCANYKTGENRMVVAKVVRIDSGRIHFYPVDIKYYKRVYTIPALGEIGIRTPLGKALTAYHYAAKIFRKQYFEMEDGVSINYKIINLHSKKWNARFVDI